jgi:hypothetical protein
VLGRSSLGDVREVAALATLLPHSLQALFAGIVSLAGSAQGPLRRKTGASGERVSWPWPSLQEKKVTVFILLLARPA